MKYILNAFLVLVLAAFMMQCEVVSNDLLDDPNAPNPENASPDFLLNNIETGTAQFFNNIQDEASDLTRMTHIFATTYPSAYQAQEFDDEWEDAYSDILIDVQALIPIAQERNLTTHEGIARVLKAYVLINLVDRFGDVPYSEALSSGNFNPEADSGREVYAAAFAELDTARTVLGQDPLAAPASDLFYDGDQDSWITLANTLELKALVQQRNIGDPVLPAGVSGYSARVNALLQGDVIDEPAESFYFQYGTNTNNPDTRHPEFTENYLTGANTYMANYYMNELWQDKSSPDPRIRYYFYRQTDAPTDDPNEQDCINNNPPSHYQGIDGSGEGLNDPFCEDWNDVGYWGRDHGNADGIPPDNLLRTTYGPYPVGGRFDADQAAGVSEDQGLQGAGIQPMWMSFFTDFVRAEVELTVNNNPGEARTALMSGIENSMYTVSVFGAPAVQAAASDTTSDMEITTSGGAVDDNQVAAYMNEVGSRWDGETADNQESILAKEFYLALFGNGVESYNLYRRVAPAKEDPYWNMQPNLAAQPGQFYNSIIYPAAYVERNSAAQRKDPETGPFWFTADPTFGNF